MDNDFANKMQNILMSFKSKHVHFFSENYYWVDEQAGTYRMVPSVAVMEHHGVCVWGLVHV